MKIGEGVEQAIHCVLMLSNLQPDGALPAAALAAFHGVKTSYLLKHLQAMAGAGLLASIPGPRGGYRLARRPEDISLLDIVLAVEGPAPAFRCAEIRQRGPNPLPAEFHRLPCGVASAMLRAERAYRAELATITIAELRGDQTTPLNQAINQRNCAFLDLHERAQTERT
ncbi:transcriptional regulator [Youhaiella tibetensis]|uniref:Rrf2 family transcriptional regulator n=1 Tax=Paradevosia tibetensis TaxID=1447062 RepID=A0A5B9DSZ9_9HYPH|nr:Rrf2 family transcriptional regulator [Youhaiella tibetensis]QEE22571.1 Rrf2 family transcriptional regulator [Youhaiella tibetensis]GGF40973.1 transcriptional regulator [Youhaiella tibetensis]